MGALPAPSPAYCFGRNLGTKVVVHGAALTVVYEVLLHPDHELLCVLYCAISSLGILYDTHATGNIHIY